MRRDVHIGLAIGGVLLAVLIVWGVVVSGSKKQVKAVTLDTTTDKSPPSSGNDIPPPLTPAPTVDTPSVVVVTTPSAAQPAADPTPAPVASMKKDWPALLAGKVSPDPEPVKTETPVAADSGASPAPADLSAAPLATIAAPGSQSAPASLPPSPADPTPAPAPATAVDPAPAAAISASPAARTHTVQRGETFSSISKAVYGDARYYEQIAQANPKINANRLRPGTVINLPDISEVKSAGKSAGPAAPSEPGVKPPAAAAPSVDSQKEYRVAAGDSLYKISMRLYGSGEETDHLYEMNKTTIGADRARLKVGMILKIPAPPTVATASASR